MREIKLKAIAENLNDENVSVIGDENHIVNRVSPPDKADKNSLCVLWDISALENLSIDIAIAAPEEFFEPGRSGIVCKRPRALLAKILAVFSERRDGKNTIHPRAVISPDSKLEQNVSVGACAVIGPGCIVGEGSIIEPNAVLLENVKVGKNCIIHSGAVIGTDGFGFERTENGLVKVPQIGGVTIGDDVEIGACTTIDRGTMSDTVISSGTKIDNHVQVGHNVKIGRNCIICSMSGIAGSSVIEDDVTVAVQSGITDHVCVGKGSVLVGRTGVTHDIKPGAIVGGYPARPFNEAKRALVLAADLPLLYKRVRIIEKKIDTLQKS